jgi:hypothetical protein
MLENNSQKNISSRLDKETAIRAKINVTGRHFRVQTILESKADRYQ